MKKLMLVDGLSILNRAFYGVPPLTNKDGIHTNAIFGFLNILFKMLEDEKPDYLAVAFDVKAKTFRHEMYPEYKGTRKGMPEELRMQVPLIKEVLSAMNILIYELAGYEADDLLGTLARKAEQKGMQVTLISGDRDLLQIASDIIKIRIPKTKGGKTEIEDYYAKDVVEKYSVTPEIFIELKALMGDTADNIPGVPKVGEKTATSLLVEYGCIDGIYDNIEQISKNAIKQSLIDNRNLAILSKELATIKVDCEVELDIKKAIAKDYFTRKAYEICKRLDLKAILKKFDLETIEEVNTHVNVTENFRTLTSLTDVLVVFEEAKKFEYVGLFALVDDDLYGFSISYGDKTYTILISKEVNLGDIISLVTELKLHTIISLFFAKDNYKIFDLKDCENIYDLVIGAYLINPLKNDYDMVSIASEYLDLTLPTYKEFFGKQTIYQVAMLEENKLNEYIAYHAYVANKVYPRIREEIKNLEMQSLMEEIELPLSYVLYDMEKTGIIANKEQLKEYGERLQVRIDELESEIYQKAGTTFNINSPKQLGEILFEKLELPGSKKTKTGYSTAADILEKLSQDYPIVDDILEYRGLTKLKSTYADGLSNYIEADGRIHTKYQQTVTATGRLSSTEPNLQNIPMRTERGREFRKVFVAKEGYVLMDADYSQIELRILAHMSKDEQLIEAYKMDEDIHKITASKVFHTPFEEVTDLQRRNAKAVNFGIIYGISSFGLSRDLSITTKEAQRYIKQYFETYPRIKDFLDNVVSDAKKDGYCKTLYERRRPIKELSSSNFMQRSFGERIAMNSPIQGTAADIMKIAMIKVYKALKDNNLESKLILQVHDELVIETKKSEVEQVEVILRDNMQYAADLLVDLEVDLHTGTSWYEAK